jgi:four helix bundle protein
MKEALKQRTKEFALRIIRLVQCLPPNKVGDTLGKQILRSGTSVGANYRSACRARSQAEFIAKLGIVEEEADETVFWIELLMENNTVKSKLLEDLH